MNKRLQHAINWSVKSDNNRGEMEEKARRGVPQFIYFIQAGEFVKIGISNDVQSRIIQMQTGNPHKLVLLNVLRSTKPRYHERKIHIALAKYHHRGEWFKITSEAVMLLIVMKKAVDKDLMSYFSAV